MDACNYVYSATLDDGSCEYPDWYEDCDGVLIHDQCPDVPQLTDDCGSHAYDIDAGGSM